MILKWILLKCRGVFKHFVRQIFYSTAHGKFVGVWTSDDSQTTTLTPRRNFTGDDDDRDLIQNQEILSFWSKTNWNFGAKKYFFQIFFFNVQILGLVWSGAFFAAKASLAGMQGVFVGKEQRVGRSAVANVILRRLTRGMERTRSRHANLKLILTNWNWMSKSNT